MLPLAGVRVLDLSRFLAGPYCASILADLGATVIRVEPVEGGEDRGLVPLGEGSPGGAIFLQTNRNKQSLAMDIRSPDGRAVLERLIATADVVLTNLTPDTLARARLDRDTLTRIKPDLVTANISAYGAEGELSSRNGFDGVGQAMSGAAWLAGDGDTPARAGCSYVDFGAGLAAAVGVLAALIRRARTGQGEDVQASLLGTALTFANPWHIEEATRALGRQPFGNRSPNSAPSDVFRTRDGHIVVQVIGTQMFARWARLMGRPELIDDPRLQDDAQRGREAEWLSGIMSEWTQSRSSAEALAILAQHGLPAGPVHSPRQLIEDPLVAETQLLWPMPVPGQAIPAPIAGPLVRLDGVGPAIRDRAPFVGEHTAQVLRELGLSAAEISALTARGTIASHAVAPADEPLPDHAPAVAAGMRRA
jgi:formyl-CoA transferase